MPKKNLLKNYITPEGEERIKTYQYKCQTDSLMYRYIMGPLANFHVKHVPMSLAPNSITFIAFMFNIIPHFLLIWYSGESLSVEIPRWLCVLTGVCQFLYMHFDNMDGKQARRTGSSSSLGMLYDHGLDSVSGWMMALNLASACRLGNDLFSYCTLMWVPVLGFYFTMWEEYQLDFIKFGKVNPVDEGLSFFNLVIIFTGIVGSQWWLKDAVFGFQRNQFLAGIIVLGCTAGIIKNIFTVVTKYKGKKHESLDSLKVSVFLIICMFIFAFLSPTNISARRTRSLVTCFGLGFCKVIGHMQLAHCAGDVFYQWRRSFLLSSIILVANTVLASFLGKALISEDLLLNLAIVFNFFCFLHYVLSITQQLKRVLNVNVFTVKPQPQSKPIVQVKEKKI